MLKSVFDKYYAKEYANPRNTAAGKVRDKKGEGKDSKNLRLIAFNIIHDNASNKEDERFEELKSLGFEIPDSKKGNVSDIIKWHEKIADEREKLDYEIDGTVVRINDISVQEELGDLHMRPKGQRAWKFDPAVGFSKVRDIKWQVGLTGRITGVAIIDPVEIGGVTVTNVSLHNIKYFKNLKLSEGDEVSVIRAGDVIPYINGNITKEVYLDSNET